MTTQFAPWDGRRVPFTLLGGYLGAGKTTLLNELLARTQRPIAVLVNDVGEVNVDAGLIRSRTSDTIEFTDGCVCCATQEGLVAALDQVRARPVPPDQVVLELSGLAEPARVLPWTQSLGFRLDGVVIVVDAVNLIDQLTQPIVGVAIQAQIEAADLVVISKADLVDDAHLGEVRHRLADLVPEVPVVVSDSALATAGVLELGARFRRRETPPVNLFDHHTVELVDDPAATDEDGLRAVVDGFGPTVVRVKGVVELADSRRVLVQKVGRRCDITDLPRSEWTDDLGLVVIRLPT